MIPRTSSSVRVGGGTEVPDPILALNTLEQASLQQRCQCSVQGDSIDVFHPRTLGNLSMGQGPPNVVQESQYHIPGTGKSQPRFFEELSAFHGRPRLLDDLVAFSSFADSGSLLRQLHLQASEPRLHCAAYIPPHARCFRQMVSVRRVGHVFGQDAYYEILQE